MFSDIAMPITKHKGLKVVWAKKKKKKAIWVFTKPLGAEADLRNNDTDSQRWTKICKTWKITGQKLPLMDS